MALNGHLYIEVLILLMLILCDKFNRTGKDSSNSSMWRFSKHDVEIIREVIMFQKLIPGIFDMFR